MSTIIDVKNDQIDNLSGVAQINVEVAVNFVELSEL